MVLLAEAGWTRAQQRCPLLCYDGRKNTALSQNGNGGLSRYQQQILVCVE